MRSIRANSRLTTFVPTKSDADLANMAQANGARRRRSEAQRRAFVSKLTSGQVIAIQWTFTDGTKRTLIGRFKGVRLWCNDQAVIIATVVLESGKVVHVDALRLRRP
jgi:hypothetical protein